MEVFFFQIIAFQNIHLTIHKGHLTLGFFKMTEFHHEIWDMRSIAFPQFTEF